MINSTHTGAAMHVRGSVIVIAVLVVMGIAALAVFLFKPRPMSALEVARQKQELVFWGSETRTDWQLENLTQGTLDSYIDMLNYILRLRDSLNVMGQTSVAVDDAEYSIEEANQKLVVTSLAQRETAARAKVLVAVGRLESSLIDSLYGLAHQPMPHFPEDSTLIRDRNLTFGRYVARIFE